MSQARLNALHLALLRSTPANGEELNQHLQAVHNDQHVYWCTLGADCLVSINPRDRLMHSQASMQEDDLYGEECAWKYAQLAPSISCSVPHPYGVATRMQWELLTLRQSRSVACLGFGASGKSETAKLLLQALLITGPVGPQILAHGGRVAYRERVNAALLLLEAFSSTSNEHSLSISKDSKQIDLLYCAHESGLYINSVGIRSQAFDYWHVLGEREGRNFNIFHYLLAGLSSDLCNAYGLNGKGCWKVLNNPQGKPAELDDKDGFNEVQAALQLLGINRAKEVEICALLAAILHLGNVEFVAERGKISGHQDKQAAVIKNRTTVEQAASCLGVTEQDLEICLLQSLELVSGERCSVMLGPREAEQKRDSCIVFLYWALYQHILHLVNELLGNGQFTDEDEQLKISIFDTPSEQHSARQDSLDLLRDSLHYQWIDKFIGAEINQPIEQYIANGFECRQQRMERKQGLIEKISSFLECDELPSESKGFSQEPEGGVNVEWNFATSVRYSISNAQQQLAIQRGHVHCDWIDLARASTNTILDSIANDRALITCVDFREKRYATAPGINAVTAENVSYWILHLNTNEPQGFLMQLAHFHIPSVLQRKTALFDTSMVYKEFLSRFARIFATMKIPCIPENIVPFLEMLQIAPGMYQPAGNDGLVLLRFEAIQLLEECLQEVLPEVEDWMPKSLSFEMNDLDLHREEQAPLLTEIPPSSRPFKCTSMTNTRRKWLAFTRLITWWVPDKMLVHFGKMDISEVRQAWREKVALCSLILVFSCFMLFNVTMLAKIICPTQHIFTMNELSQFPSNKPHVAVFGRVYDVSKLVGDESAAFLIKGAGTDMSKYFKFQPRCNWSKNYRKGASNNNGLDVNALKPYYVGDVGFPRDFVNGYGGPTDARIIVNNRVYNISSIVGKYAATNLQRKNMSPRAYAALTTPPYGADRSVDFRYPNAANDIKCLGDFYEGDIDQRNSFRCKFAEYLLIGCTGIIVAVMLVKFIAAIQFPTRRDPEPVGKFVIMQVPCYTENEQSLRVTIESLATMDYEDSKKLLFIICDGMLIGSGNDKPTARIVLDILQVPPEIDPEPLSYLAIAEGNKRHNQAKVYAGLYRVRQHVVPFIVLAKCGAPQETGKPGNRGKRDSQMILLNLLNKLYYNKPMTPMEVEVCRQIHSVIGVDPKAYEYILQVDADTEVASDALTKMISALNNDARIIGLCGETEVGNEKASLITMIQVYEYYISHHLAKAFESLFGTVTCLPGCFSIFRIRSMKNEIFVVADSILTEYSNTSVNTLHKKNLLHLGEDRFLTTLLIKNFPYNKLCFIGDAKCRTIVPDSWAVLLSQRRRWINSTVHNLFELVLLNELCGFCVFSMKFVVIIDLFATLVMPATVVYLVYLIVASVAKQKAPIISLIMFSLAYGMQALIFICKGQLQHIGWMLLNILSMPLFNFFIPLYSFWHFDDFSWGNTRRVVGDDGRIRHEIVSGECEFDDSTIETMRWTDYCLTAGKPSNAEQAATGYDQTVDPLQPSGTNWYPGMQPNFNDVAADALVFNSSANQATPMGYQSSGTPNSGHPMSGYPGYVPIVMMPNGYTPPNNSAFNPANFYPGQQSPSVNIPASGENSSYRSSPNDCLFTSPNGVSISARCSAFQPVARPFPNACISVPPRIPMTNDSQLVEQQARFIVHQAYAEFSHACPPENVEEMHLRIKQTTSHRLGQMGIDPVLMADLVDQEIGLLLGRMDS